MNRLFEKCIENPWFYCVFDTTTFYAVSKKDIL